MSDDPRQGVVDADCRVHEVKNLFVISSSVFATSGQANLHVYAAGARRFGWPTSCNFSYNGQRNELRIVTDVEIPAANATQFAFQHGNRNRINGR